MDESVQMYLQIALTLLEDACDVSEDPEINEVRHDLARLLNRKGETHLGQSYIN